MADAMARWLRSNCAVRAKEAEVIVEALVAKRPVKVEVAEVLVLVFCFWQAL